ncbi:MAG: hypothetical protein QM655_04180 [Nocardioidaceae bacterium]
MTGLDHAIHDLEAALDTSQRQSQLSSWRGIVRQRMTGVHDALTGEERCDEAWLVARESHLRRERRHLVARVDALSRSSESSPERFQHEIRRLLADLEHHRQRLNDLVYDSVAMDLGGSE